MATRNNTTALIRAAVAIGLLLYLPFWFNKRFPSTPEPDQYKLGGEAGVAEQDPVKVDRGTQDHIDQPQDPTIDDELLDTNRDPTEREPE